MMYPCDREGAAARVQIQWLSGSRLRLSDGPIDLIVWAEGDPSTLDQAFRLASMRFVTILDELVSELPLLRTPLGERGPSVHGRVARRMLRAASPYREHALTPMIAVAGAVADEVLEAMQSAGPLARAYVNNGGDVAVQVESGSTLRIGIVPELGARGLRMPDAHVEISGDSPVAGIATSGCSGRSFSLGIADAVTALASDAASADAAATLIANAVDVDHPSIERVPARDLDPDTDLGDRLVTLSRAALPAHLIDRALDRGERVAASMLEERNLFGVFLACGGKQRILGEAVTMSAHSDA